MQDVERYCQDILSGRIRSGIEVQQAVKRYYDDLKRPDLYFNAEKIEHVFRFFSCLQHTKDRHAGKYFVLEPWQKFFLSQVFGWYYTSSKKRRYTEVYFSVAKKNGKTAIAAGIMLYCLFFENGGNMHVLASNSREQAMLNDFKACDDFTKNLDPEKEYIRQRYNTLYYENSQLKCISSENRTKDGLGLKTVYIDEFHAFPTWDLYNNLKSSQIDLEEKLFIVSTTAGTNKAYPCYELETTAKEILAGLKTDDNFFALIYSLPETMEWQLPENWIISNPNLNVTVLYKNLQDEVLRAKNNISLENDIKTKNFNVWCSVAKTWIPDHYIISASRDLKFDYYEGLTATVGADLSEVSDVTAVSWQFEIDGNYHYINKYYLPIENHNSKIDQTTYQNWQKQGFITLIPGNRIDYEFIANDIQQTAEKNNIYVQAIAYDDWHAKPFAADMKSRGYKMKPVPQSIGKFSPGTMEFERLILGKNIVIDNNKITRWMFSNCVLREDQNGNKKPDKARSSNKIDGVIAMLTALNYSISQPKYDFKIY